MIAARGTGRPVSAYVTSPETVRSGSKVIEIGLGSGPGSSLITDWTASARDLSALGSVWITVD